MKRRATLRDTGRATVIGLVVGLLLISQPAAKAQLLSTVFDPKVFSELARHNVREDKNWIETAQFYAKQISKIVEQINLATAQLSTTKGILGLTEDVLSRDTKKRRRLAELGKTIKDVMGLKRQLERLVFYDIRGLRNIEQRFRNGIFDPKQNVADLWEYLTVYLGNISQAKIEKLERCATLDVRLRRLMQDLQKVEFELTVASRDLDEAETRLKEETANPMPTVESVQTLSARVSDLQKRIDDLKTQRRVLLDAVEQRFELYELDLEARERFAQRVKQDLKAWEDFSAVKGEVLDVLKNVEQFK